MLAGELAEALVQDELRLHYQPIYDLDTRSIIAVEALLRWQHPTRGLLPWRIPGCGGRPTTDRAHRQLGAGSCLQASQDMGDHDGQPSP